MTNDQEQLLSKSEAAILEQTTRIVIKIIHIHREIKGIYIFCINNYFKY